MRRLVLGLGCGVLVGCFDAPSADVMFSCDPASAPACPSGYTCEVDGCCHRDGSDVDAHAGECKLQGGTDAATTLLTGAATETETSTGTGSSDTGTTTDASTSIATTESSSSAADTSSGGASSSGGSDASATGESTVGSTT